MRCAIYARYSSDLQDKRSIRDQIDECRKYAERVNWTVLEEHIYTDAAISAATTTNRPALTQLRQEAQRRPKVFDYVLIEDTSRLSRDRVDQQEIVRELGYHGIGIYFVSQMIDSLDEQSAEIILPIHAIKDSFYRRELAQKTRRGMAGQLKAGYSPGGRAYGYKFTKELDPSGTIDRNTGMVRVIGTKISIDEKVRPIVLEIFSRFAQGWSLKEICKDLNERRIDPPGIDDQRRRKLKVRPSWCPSGIRFMLLSSKYGGLWLWNTHKSSRNHATGKRRYEARPREEWVEREFPELRIVAQEVIDAVQARFKVTQHTKKHGHTGVKSDHLLSGLMNCGCCNARVVIIGGGERDDPLYGCGINWNRGKEVCANNARVRKSVLEETLLGLLRQKIFAPDSISLIVKEANALLGKEHQKRPGMVGELQAKLDQAKTGIGRIIEAIENGLGTSGDLKARLLALEQEKRNLEAQIASAKSAVKSSKIKIDAAYAEKWILRLDEIVRGGTTSEKAGVRACLKRVTLEPVVVDGKRCVKLEAQPNLTAILGAVGVAPTSTNGGGRI